MKAQEGASSRGGREGGGGREAVRKGGIEWETERLVLRSSFSDLSKSEGP